MMGYVPLCSAFFLRNAPQTSRGGKHTLLECSIGFYIKLRSEQRGKTSPPTPLLTGEGRIPPFQRAGLFQASNK
ncbi:hypothetical protein AFK68_16265 [Hydrocoleum sp. CS-953]|nr:hypothetical protein AFK68_32195 [Hydrocoleum sp. CS-953]OZH53639.1 hypothetical protein AFK68_16265 [Hydrocoleum sp. CS-953]